MTVRKNLSIIQLLTKSRWPKGGRVMAVWKDDPESGHSREGS